MIIGQTVVAAAQANRLDSITYLLRNLRDMFQGKLGSPPLLFDEIVIHNFIISI